jgi:hypothetical protein
LKNKGLEIHTIGPVSDLGRPTPNQSTNTNESQGNPTFVADDNDSSTFDKALPPEANGEKAMDFTPLADQGHEDAQSRLPKAEGYDFLPFGYSLSIVTGFALGCVYMSFSVIRAAVPQVVERIIERIAFLFSLKYGQSVSGTLLFKAPYQAQPIWRGFSL